MRDLFFGTGLAHSILLFAVVIFFGLLLARIKVKGVSIGSTWILFVGILLSHLGFRADPVVLAFVKEFGLILFVFSIGLQVGPGFFHSFKSGGLTMNLLAFGMVLMAAITTYIIHLVSGEDLCTMVGVMSGAVTNTPGLGAAQQTITDVMASNGASPAAAASASSGLASSYAVAYPLGVLGVIAVLIALRAIFKVDIEGEKKAVKEADGPSEEVRRVHCEVGNPGIYGKTLKEIQQMSTHNFVVSRVLQNGQVSIPGPDTVLNEGDKVLVVTSPAEHDSVLMIFGREVPLHLADWQGMSESLVSKQLVVTKSSMTGRKLRDLRLRDSYGVTVTRVLRSGIQLVGTSSLRLQVGDILQVVGNEQGINAVADIVGNRQGDLSHANILPIFGGIALGVILGMIPIKFPGVPQPVKLGLAGGPLIVAILLGHFGPKWHITTYTTQSANMMIREIGICLFMAAVGIGAGENFVSALTGGGYMWVLYGALITLIPTLLIGIIGRVWCKLNFFEICGLITGGTTNPPVLAFAQKSYDADYVSVNYAKVYPLSMFLRVLTAQILILMAI